MPKVFLYMSSSFHNAYGHMVRNHPDGFEITASEFMAHGHAGASGTVKSFSKAMQPRVSSFYNRLLILLNRPKVREFDCEGYELVHSAQSLLRTNVPYVMDFEHAAVFSGYNQYALRRGGFVRALKRLMLEKNLKKLMSWSNAARESLLNFVKDKELEDKTETFYPVSVAPGKTEKRKHSGINFLFIGNVFFEKGGLETLLAFDKISKKYDVRLTMRAPVPEEIVKKFGKNERIRFLGRVPYEEIQRAYQESDALVFPTHYDTYGFVVPEAFSYGLPVISVDSFSMPELVENERTGLIVRSFYSSFLPDRSYRYGTLEELTRRRQEDCMHPTEEYVNELSGAMTRIVEDGRLRERLSLNAKKETVDGKLSVKSWKQRIGRIYKEALEG